MCTGAVKVVAKFWNVEIKMNIEGENRTDKNRHPAKLLKWQKCFGRQDIDI